MPRWLKADLHIHSALSPCSLPEMTPNNIVNMAAVLGLDVIAITDHLAADNVLAVQKLAKEKGMLCLPGVELQSREEVHLLCYFLTNAELMVFAEQIFSLLDHSVRLPAHAYQQQCLNEKDEIIKEHEVFLHQSVPLTIEDMWQLATNYGACCLPAHIDRPAFGLLGQLGFIPPSLPVATVEATMPRVQELQRSGRYRAVVTASDAHSLDQMVTVGHTHFHPSLRSIDDIWQCLKEAQASLIRSFQTEI